MELTKEMLTKAKETKTVEELVAIAKENGMELTFEEAEECFARLHKSGELSDDELDNVSGGGCGSTDESNASKRNNCKHQFVMQADHKIKATVKKCILCGYILAGDL